MNAYQSRLVLRVALWSTLIIVMLFVLLSLAPTPALMAQGQSTPPPRETPAPTRSAPGPGRDTPAAPTAPSGESPPGATPVPSPAGLPAAGEGMAVDLSWLFIGVTLVVMGGLIGLTGARRSRSV